MLRRLGLVSCLVVVLATSPAHADAWSAPDPSGDATSYRFDPEPEPCGTVTEVPVTEGDITRLAVRHNRRRIVLTLHVSGLTKPWRVGALFTLVTPDKEWEVDVDRRHGRTQVDFHRAPRFEPSDGDECGSYLYSYSPRTCAGASGTIDVEAGRISASLPRGCFGSPRWVRGGGQVFGGGRTADDTFSDIWLPSGFDGDYAQPLVGRRVYSGPRR